MVLTYNANNIYIIHIYLFPLEDPTFLSFRRGDVLYIIKDEEYNIEEGWIKARNERTSQTGAVSLDSIQILPMLTRPTEETLVNMISRFTLICRRDYSSSLAIIVFIFFTSVLRFCLGNKYQNKAKEK